MGGVLNINYHCCIHDSKFKDDCKDKEHTETLEQKALNMGDKTIDKIIVLLLISHLGNILKIVMLIK